MYHADTKTFFPFQTEDWLGGGTYREAKIKKTVVDISANTRLASSNAKYTHSKGADKKKKKKKV